MEELGTIQTLSISRLLPHGAYLQTSVGDVLLPIAEVPEGVEEDSWIEVFLYCDSEDRWIATTKRPLAIVGEFATLEVADTNRVGAFLRWGLMKDLLLPHGEQKGRLFPGDKVVIQVVVDKQTNRLIATQKLGRFLDKSPVRYLENQEVDVLVVDRMELGFRVVVEEEHWGMIYHSEIFQDIRVGMKLKAYVLLVREDGKVDIVLQKPGPEKVNSLEGVILEKLSSSNGRIEFGDKTASELIQKEFRVSKKTFKKALGALYKKGLVELEPGSTTLLSK